MIRYFSQVGLKVNSILYTLNSCFKQIAKLHKCHLTAIRVSGSNTQLLGDVKEGKYKFG